MKSITYSAPGKIILSGEHSVVYGKPALVTAIDLRLTCSIWEDSPVDNKSKTSKAVSYCSKVIISYLKKKRIKFKERTFDYKITSAIPSSRGLGSSAAFCVALSAALLHFYTLMPQEKQIINSLAYQAEKYFHGMPSGVDVSASCFGGLIFYRKEFEFLKQISALNFKLKKSFEDRLLLIDTGKPKENTAKMVRILGNKYNKDPEVMFSALCDIEKVTKRMVISIVKEDLKMFKDALRDNQKLLSKIGIVSSSARKFIDGVEMFGTGKVTGAGGVENGSGMLLFLQKDVNSEVVLRDKIKIIPFKQDSQGVRLES